MKNFKKNIFVLFSCVLMISGVLSMVTAQDKPVKKDKTVYQFEMVKSIPHTPPKSQGRTGTCWCFATVSFIEAEAMRLGAEEFDLSEMFIVRHIYPHKADNYIRLHGKANFSEGGLSHDGMEQYADFGIVPESAYSGLNLGSDRHNHAEMVKVLTNMLESVLKSRRPSIRWKEAFNAVADVYMGAVPETFEYKKKKYTPIEFAEKVVKVNAADYVELTSFGNYEYYAKCRLQIPDNWNFNDDYYNVPLCDLVKVVDYALENGYTVAWDGDVSERGFAAGNKGVAVIPADDKMRGFNEPVEEKTITCELRQQKFDNFSTTDDHLMHIVGLAKDESGKTFYYFKNSWGSEGIYDGYFYMSVPYYKLKTTAIMVHKDALPRKLRKKLGL